jgi:2'-5' RNA ligase
VSDDSGALRLFVAVELPEAWTEALAEMQRRLAELTETPESPRWRWVRPEGIHATLKFLGNVPPERLPWIEASLAAAITQAPGMRLRLGQVGSFMGPGRTLRVLWCGVEGETEELVRLAATVNDACAEAGFEPEKRPFAPHLTLARAGERSVIHVDASFQEQIRSLEAPSTPEFVVQRVSLMRSHLERGGARYERVKSWPAEALT